MFPARQKRGVCNHLMYPEDGSRCPEIHALFPVAVYFSDLDRHNVSSHLSSSYPVRDVVLLLL